MVCKDSVDNRFLICCLYSVQLKTRLVYMGYSNGKFESRDSADALSMHKGQAWISHHYWVDTVRFSGNLFTQWHLWLKYSSGMIYPHAVPDSRKYELSQSQKFYDNYQYITLLDLIRFSHNQMRYKIL